MRVDNLSALVVPAGVDTSIAVVPGQLDNRTRIGRWIGNMGQSAVDPWETGVEKSHHSHAVRSHGTSPLILLEDLRPISISKAGRTSVESINGSMSRDMLVGRLDFLSLLLLGLLSIVLLRRQASPFYNGKHRHDQSRAC